MDIRHSSLARRSLTAITVAIALAACSSGTLSEDGDGPGSGPASDADLNVFAWGSACSLLAEVNVDGLLGEPVAGASVDTATTCQLEADDPDSTGTVHLYVTSPGGRESYLTQKNLLGVDQEVSSLGDEAFISGGFVNVLVDDHHFNLVVIRHPLTDGAVTAADLEEAARGVLTKTGWRN